MPRLTDISSLTKRLPFVHFPVKNQPSDEVNHKKERDCNVYIEKVIRSFSVDISVLLKRTSTANVTGNKKRGKGAIQERTGLKIKRDFQEREMMSGYHFALRQNKCTETKRVFGQCLNGGSGKDRRGFSVKGYFQAREGKTEQGKT